MKYSICKYKYIKKESLDFSINAEFFTPDIVELRNKLKAKNFKPLREYAAYIKRGLQPEYNPDGKIKVLRSVNIREMGFSDDRQEFIDNDFYYANPRGCVAKSDVLLNSTGVGTLGRACLVYDDEKYFIDGHITRLSSLSAIKPEFLYVYLNSKYGQFQINKLHKGSSGQIEIYPEQIQLILIKPLKIQSLIAKIVQKSFENNALVRDLYINTKNILLKELNIFNWQPKHKLYSIKKYSDVENVNRFDAEYFQPKYDEILEIINRNNHTTLIEQFDILRNSGLIYELDGKNGVIKTKQIKENFIDYNIEDRTNQGDSNTIVKDRDVLFASMGVGSLGKTNIYYNFENKDSYIIDSTLKIFRAKTNGKISPEYLETYLHSRLAQELIYQNIVGSSGIISIYESYLQNLPIPIIDNKAEEQIVKNVRNAHLYNYQSKQLLEIAKRGVEIAIEENEDIATEWINEQLLKIGVML